MINASSGLDSGMNLSMIPKSGIREFNKPAMLVKNVVSKAIIGAMTGNNDTKNARNGNITLTIKKMIPARIAPKNRMMMTSLMIPRIMEIIAHFFAFADASAALPDSPLFHSLLTLNAWKIETIPNGK
jgi:hypothetical protein